VLLCLNIGFTLRKHTSLVGLCMAELLLLEVEAPLPIDQASLAIGMRPLALREAALGRRDLRLTRLKVASTALALHDGR